MKIFGNSKLKGVNMKKSINCMIFDFGGVIGFPQDKIRVKRMMELTNMKDDFEVAYFLHRHPYDEGLIDKYEYWRRITNGQLDLTEELIDALVKEDNYSWTKINDAVIKLIKKLKSKVDKIVLLSNINFEAKSYIKDGLKLFDLFDETFCSCDLKLMKPDTAIYKHVITELNVDPDQCLFMDDSIDNVNGAIKAGINGLHFINYPQFQDELQENYQLSKTE